MKYRRACNIKCMYYVHRCNNEKRVEGKIELLGMYCLWLETTNIFSFFLPKKWNIYFWKPKQKNIQLLGNYFKKILPRAPPSATLRGLRQARRIVKISSKNVLKIFPKKIWEDFLKILWKSSIFKNILFQLLKIANFQIFFKKSSQIFFWNIFAVSNLRGNSQCLLIFS